jgi:hypothetical protein
MTRKSNPTQPTTKEACLCCMLREAMRGLGPPEAARRHFEAARLEFLKGIRELLDARIQRRSKRSARGEKIDVE